MSQVEAPIVAPLPALPSWRVQRWRIWVAALLIATAGLAALWRALNEPSTGYLFSVAPDRTIQAQRILGDGPTLRNVRALSAGGLRVPLYPDLLVESGGIINRYSEQRRFYAEHARIWQVLQSDLVDIEHATGVTHVDPDPKAVQALGLRFWYPWFIGLLSLSVGLGLWIYSPRRLAAHCFCWSSAGYAYIMLSLACGSSRLLTQAPTGWAELHMLAHLATFVQNGSLCLLLWNYPTRLGGRWFGFTVLGWSIAWLTVDWAQWVDTISIGFRLPAASHGPVFVALFIWQWRRAAGEPLARAQLKWLILLFAAAFSVLFVAFAVGATGAEVKGIQVYGLSWLALLYLGLVPVVTKIGLFQLEAWWVRAWMWFVGGLVVVALDAALVGLLSIQTDYALMLALAVGGWAYFPLRQWLWGWLSRDAGAQTQDLLPEMVALISRSSLDAAARTRDWRVLLEKAFMPRAIEEVPDAVSQAWVQDDGRRLLVPGGEGLPALSLDYAMRGQRLFTLADARRANEISQLIRLGLRTHSTVESSLRQERSRIASDLHDDLGATLLTIAQVSPPTSQGQRVASLARQALEEMRLSVRGLTAEPARAEEVLADWRAETVARLELANIQPVWQVANPPEPDLTLPARTHVQITRVLREAVSNVIRHSQGTRCEVRLRFRDGWLSLEVQDNGRGLPKQAQRQGMGHGLPNIERRVRKLDGVHGFEIINGGGTRLWLQVPLHDQSANIDAP